MSNEKPETVSDEAEVTEPTPTTSPEAPTPPDATPVIPKPEFTEDELEGFTISEDIQDILDSAEEEKEELTKTRQQALDNAQRQIAAFDGAIEEAGLFAQKALARAKKRFVEKKKKAAKPLDG